MVWVQYSTRRTTTTTTTTTTITTTICLRAPLPPPLLPLSIPPSSNTYLHHAQPTGPKCRDRSIHHPFSLTRPLLVCAAPGSIGNNAIAYQTRGPEHINHLRIKEDAYGLYTCVPSRDSTGRVQSVREYRPQARPFLQQHSPLHRVAWRETKAEYGDCVLSTTWRRSMLPTSRMRSTRRVV